MSFAITGTAGVLLAGAGLAYTVYSGEKAAHQQRLAEQASDREQQRLEREEKDQKAKLEATELRDRMRLAQRSTSLQSQGRAGTILTNPASTTLGGTYTGKTLIGG